MMLSQNSKMKKATLKTYDFCLPKRVCIGKGECDKWCFMNDGFYNMPIVKAKHEKNLKDSMQDDFIYKMHEEIKKLKPEAIRIHSGGDFYSREYLNKWLWIIDNNPNVVFYCYTKSIPLFLHMKQRENFRIVYSLGGKWDYLIKEHNLRSCETVNYYSNLADSSDDDDSTIIFSNRNIELIRR